MKPIRRTYGILVLVTGLLVAMAAACSSYGTPSGGGAAPTATRAPAAGPTQAPGAGGTKVDIQGFAFIPASITVTKGTAITWTNKDSVAHTVTATEPAGAFDSGSLATGATFSFTFNTVGTFSYYCKIHPNMKGTVVVRETP